MRWAGYMTRMGEKRHMYRVSVVIPEIEMTFKK
jgi:hypothetical protein